MRVCLALIVASALGRVAWLGCGGNGVAIEVLTPLRMDGLAIGSWIALAARGEQGLDWLTRYARPAAFVCGLAALVLWLVNKRLLGVPYTLWAGFFGAMLVLAVTAGQNSWLRWFGQSSTLRFFGKYSYGAYILHTPMQPVYMRLFPARRIAEAASFLGHTGSRVVGLLGFATLGLAITMLLAVVTYHAFEKHFLKLKRYFEYAVPDSTSAEMWEGGASRTHERRG